jgi:phage tail sheath protein FI
MPVQPTYPGIYIEEIPSTARTITPAPTSTAAFIGYSHPFRTKTFGQAILLFSFADYEREFGGFFRSSAIPSYLPNAVNQFFVNGGSIAYVVGLQVSPATALARVEASIDTDGSAANKILFKGIEPDSGLPDLVTTVSIEPVVTTDPNTSEKTAEITVAYGTRVEVYRDVNLDPNDNKSRFIKDKLKDSALITVDGNIPPPPLGTKFSIQKDVKLLPVGTPPNVPIASDFVNVFEPESSLDKVDIFNLLILPGITDTSILSAALAFAEKKRAFLIMDPIEQAVAAGPPNDHDMTDLMKSSLVPKSPNGAIYFPYLKSQDPIVGGRLDLPPSGFVAGVYARTDTNRGTWKAPAGMEATLLNTTGVVETGRMTDMRQGVLNMAGVNCIRDFPGVGTVVFGARTLTSANPAFQPWKYVPVRRMALFIENTLYRELKWVIFEPNDEPLWLAIRTSVEAFMLSLFTQGAFQGAKPSQAFVVKCDSTTTTQFDIDNGIVNIIVGFRPLKPAEFVFVKIAQLAGQVQS